jgi:Aerotolerance regulator N-terminal/von Willebrand factor type A domain
MGFLAPWFLGGLAAVGLPIYVHLLRKHRTVPLPFSSLMFFEQRTQSSVKHRRLRYLLLFALRTAFIVLLMLAFARPFINSSSVAVAGNGHATVFAIDNSFSMRQGDRFTKAKADALAAVAALRGGDQGQVVSFSGQSRVLTEMTTDRTALRTALESIQPSDEASSYADLVRELRVLATRPIDVHLFSDMQKSSMPASFTDLQLNEKIKLIPHPVASGAVPNFTVENVLAPRHIYDPKKSRVLATIAGYGTPAAKFKASLYVNGKLQATKPVELAADGRASVEFLALDAPYGFSKGEIRIDAGDAFPADDHFYFSAERADPRPALFIQDPRNTRAFLYFRTALESSNEPAYTLTAASPDQAMNLALAKYPFIVLSDLPTPLAKGLESNLREYVNKGGALLVALGTHSRGTVPVADLVISGNRIETPEGGRFQTVISADATHPVIRRNNEWSGIKFFQTAKVEPGTARIIARLSDSSPILIDHQVGEGRVLIFASTLDNISNDLPISASFVPFVEQASHYLGNIEDRPSNYRAGSFLDLRTSKSSTSGASEVTGPKGERVLTLSEAAKAQGVTLENEGFYDVRRPTGQHELAAVNADRKESNLEPIPTETIQLWQNTGGSTNSSQSGPATKQVPQTVDLWWYVMILALILAIAESLIGNRYLAVEKEAA